MVELTGQDQHTYDAVFRHPTSGNIEWRGLLALFRHLGEVVDEPNGKLKFIRNGHAVTLDPQGKEADKDMVADIRKFLRTSETQSEIRQGAAKCLLVLDHAEARIYRTESPESKSIHIEPSDPHGWERHVHTHHVYARPSASGLHHEYFEKIANALAGAEEVLVLGDGSGSSRESDEFLQDLLKHDPNLAKRVIGVVKIDLNHMTEGEILAKAREHLTA
ncbi:MAG: hypothetical protein P4L46_20585 [Fimbriimonas sp.]|nr:hypothetical protein [Fimbriimonas sp.]